MADDYKNYYLKDLLRIIDRTALEILMTPAFSYRNGDDKMNLTELAAYNQMIAMHNEGVKEMAAMIRDALLRGEDDDDE